MRRTTITLPDDLAKLADREVRRRGGSFSSLVRDALSRYLGVGGEDRPPLPFAALGASGHCHAARDLEEILDAEWTPDRRS